MSKTISKHWDKAELTQLQLPCGCYILSKKVITIEEWPDVLASLKAFFAYLNKNVAHLVEVEETVNR